MLPIQVLRMKNPAVGIVVVDANYLLESTGGNQAKILFQSDGSLVLTDDLGVITPAGKWLSNWPNAVDAALYEIRRTQGSGTLGVTFTGTLNSGTWYPMTSDRGITVVAGVASRNNTSTFDFQLASNPGVIVATCTTDLSSDP